MWKRTSKEKYWDALEVLPPAFQDHRGFLLGEPHDHAVCEVTGTMHPRYDAYIHRADRYYVSIRPLTIHEYRKHAQTAP
jgi:hypothetical protein